MSNLSLNQIGELRRILTDKVYADHMINFNMDTLETCLNKLSEKQYKYILYLLSVKRWTIIKVILAQCGLKNKTN